MATLQVLAALLGVCGFVGSPGVPTGLVPGADVAYAHEGEQDETSVGSGMGSSSAEPGQGAEDPHVGREYLKSSWPEEGSMLLVPPKEGRLTFLEPVKSSTLTLALFRADGEALVEDEVVRLTSGENVTEILLRLPQLRPGMYELSWEVTAVSEERMEGSLRFGLEPSVAAVGGQNHRHGESHLYEDTPGQFSLRLLFVLAVTFLFAAVRRAQLRVGRGGLERMLLRVGASLLLLAALLAGVVDIVQWVDEYHDKQFSALVAAPGLSLLIPVLAFSVFLLVRARPSVSVFWCGVGALAAYAGLSHAVQTEFGAELFVVFTAFLVALALLWADTLRMLVTPSVFATVSAVEDGRSLTARRVARSLAGSAAALVVSSFLMLVLHAGTLDFEMAFARDFRSRLALSVLLVGSLGFCYYLATRRRRFRILALVPAVVVLVVSAMLAWMPPPAAGL